MDIQNNGYMSIAQLTDQYLGKTQKMPVRETKDGLTAAREKNDRVIANFQALLGA